ncbi:MAG TPA: DUF4124 domain-containing protein [Pseudoxanthomonas sp.]|nr:DUF4124 domain-containing protein [Pseudoxanthomonas sp.]
MRAVWAILLGAAAGIGLAVWLASEEHAARPLPDPRARGAADSQDADALPGLYRWRDDKGVLQITDKPPRGRPYERVDRQGDPAIAVDGQRQGD